METATLRDQLSGWQPLQKNQGRVVFRHSKQLRDVCIRFPLEMRSAERTGISLRTADATMPSFRSAAAHRPSSDEAGITMFSPSSAILAVSKSLMVTSGFLMKLFKQANAAVKFFEFPFDIRSARFLVCLLLRFINLRSSSIRLPGTSRGSHKVDALQQYAA